MIECLPLGLYTNYPSVIVQILILGCRVGVLRTLPSSRMGHQTSYTSFLGNLVFIPTFLSCQVEKATLVIGTFHCSNWIIVKKKQIIKTYVESQSFYCCNVVLLSTNKILQSQIFILSFIIRNVYIYLDLTISSITHLVHSTPQHISCQFFPLPDLCQWSIMSIGLW